MYVCAYVGLYVGADMVMYVAEEKELDGDSLMSVYVCMYVSMYVCILHVCDYVCTWDEKVLDHVG